MEVNYVTTLDDLVTLDLRRYTQTTTLAFSFLLSCLFKPLVLVGFAIYLLFFFTGPFLEVTALGLGAFAVLSGFLHSVSYKWKLRHVLWKNALESGLAGSVGRITLILTEETLTEKTEKMISMARWADMKGIGVLDKITYVYITSAVTIIIPKHGFERPEEYEAVKAFALEKLQKTNNSG